MNSFRSLSLIIFLFLLNGCSGNKVVESIFAPNSTSNSSNSNVENNNSTQNNSNNPTNKIQVPEDFPNDIPIYQAAELISIDKNSSKWSSNDPLNLISDYYQQQLRKQEWDINVTNENLIIAKKEAENRLLKLSFAVENNQSKFVITQEQKLADSTPNTSPDVNSNINNNPNTRSLSSLEQLVRLNVISEANKSNPYKNITRREYAQWLVKTNNILYANVKSKLIRLANPNSKPIFSDVPNNDPDFAVIQGLAEAGLIPSSLTQDTTAIAFRPDKPLTREDLIAWKVPLDFRQKLPNTTVDSIKDTWGFQDANQIKPQTWSQLYIDWQNGENANIRKAFGYITLFQPQKIVTYQEAAEILSSFGYQANIILLKEVDETLN